jgi:DNA polymerase sigma
MFSSQLSCEVTDFIAKLDAADVALREIKGEAVLKMRSLIRSLWPRAHVKPFGSFVSGLSLPTSDLDLVICMPKVHQENAPEVWTCVLLVRIDYSTTRELGVGCTRG